MMDPPSASLAHDPGQQQPPSPLPGRDPVADADLSHSRKRPRLSDELESPPAASNLSDTQSVSARSPTVVEIPQDRSTDPSDISIVMTSDDKMINDHVNEFPFQGEKYNTPLKAVCALVDHFKKKDVPSLENLTKFIAWLTGHLNDTEAMFDDAVKHDATASDIFAVYSDRPDFWDNVVECFVAFRGRYVITDPSALRGGEAFLFFELFLRSLVRLGERLLHTELAILVQREARRDSTSSSSSVDSSKHSLLFSNWAIAFDHLVLRTEAFLEPMSSTHRFNYSTVQKAAITRFQDHALDAIVKLFRQLVLRPELIKAPFTTGNPYVVLCIQLLRVDKYNVGGWLDGCLKKFPDLFETIYIMVTQNLVKTHLDAPSQKILDHYRIFLEETIAALSCTNHLSPANVYNLLLKDVAESPTGTGQLLESSKSANASISDVRRVDTTLGNSLIKEGLVEAATRACNLEYCNALIRSSGLDSRIRGVDKLGQEVLDICSNTHRNGSALHELLKLFTTKFLLTKDITAYLFEPQSHPTMISSSSPIVAFLSRRGHLTISDAETIWSVATNLQQPDSAQSASQVLLKVLPDMPLFTKKFFCDRFRDMPIAQLSTSNEVLFYELMNSFLVKSAGKHDYYSTCLCINLLVKVEESEFAPARRNSLQVGLGNLLLKIHRPEDIEERVAVVELCAAPIASLSSKATAYVKAMSCILQKGDFLMPQEILSRLSLKHCAEELVHTIVRARVTKNAIPEQVLACRLKLIFAIISIINPSEDTTAMEKMVWDHVVGEQALSTKLRDLGWDLLVDSFKENQPTHAAFYQRCVYQYLPSLNAKFITIGAAKIFDLQLARQESDEGMLLPLRQDLMRIVLSDLPDKVGHHFRNILMCCLFIGKALKYPDLAASNQIGVIKDCISHIHQQDFQAEKACELLRVFLVHLDLFEDTVASANEGVSDGISNPEAQGSQDCIQLPIRIHKGDAQPQQKVVTVHKSASCSDLQTAITSRIGFESYTVVTAGQRINFAEGQEQSITRLGLENGNVLLLQKHNTLKSIQDDVKKGVEMSAAKQELLSHLDVLYGALDDTSPKAHHALGVLYHLGFPGSIKAMLGSFDTPLDQIFPPGKSLRLLASIEALRSQLYKQINLGVADSNFLLRGTHLLIDLLSRNDLHQRVDHMLQASQTLLAFLRERPINDLADEYFKEPARYTENVLRLISSLQHEITSNDLKAAVVQVLFQCLIEGFLLSPAVYESFIAAENSTRVLLDLLITKNDHLCIKMPDIIANVVRDEQLPSAIKTFLSKVFIDHVIPTALRQPFVYNNTLSVGAEVLAADESVMTNEILLRSLVDEYSTALLDLEQLEQYTQPFVDKKVQGLALLLHCCVSHIAYLNKSLKLGDLASRLFKKLLFPELQGNTKPVITLDTRNYIYDLIALMCDNLETIESLTTHCEGLIGLASIQEDFTFIGPHKYARQEGGYAGLDNLGQTCYLNSLIQQLFMNVQFRKFIFDTPVVDTAKQEVLKEFKTAFALMQDSHCASYRPEALVNALNVDYTVQDDAHIFFMMLIGQLESSMPDENAKTKLKAFFRGVNRSQTIGTCKHVSTSTDEYFNLSIPVKDKPSLEQSLEEYTKGATLEGSDRFRCTTCGSGEGVSVDAVQRTALEHIPDNLVLGLRRFRYETYDGGSKVNDRFDFPERIDMSKYKLNRLAGVEDAGEPDVFQLVGVVVHQGTLQFGHYWSYAAERSKTVSGALPWYRLEDSKVTASSINEVLRGTCGGSVSPSSSTLRSDNAYVLFYQRVSSVLESANCLTKGISMSPHVMHAKVRPPEDLENLIIKDNEHKIFLLNLYALRHTEFVCGLADRVESIKDSESSKQRTVTRKVTTMLFRHFTQVLAHSCSPESIEHTSDTLQKVALSEREAAGQILLWLLPRELKSAKESLLLRKLSVRHATVRLIMACLRYLQWSHPVYYGIEKELESDTPSGILESLVHSVLHLRFFLPERGFAVWRDYLDLVCLIAELGPQETCIVLQQGFLQWCLEVLWLKNDSSLHKKHMDIVKYFEDDPRQIDFVPLFSCVYRLLLRFVDLRGGTIHSHQQRWADSGLLLLTTEEHNLLSRLSNTRCNWMVECCLQSFESLRKSDWHTWPTARLAALLTNAGRVSIDLYEETTRTLLFHLQYSDNWDNVAEVVSLCLIERRMKSITEEAIFAEMANILQSRDSNNDPSLAVLTVQRIIARVYSYQPMMILHHLARLTSLSLICEETDTEKATRDWLRDAVLVQESLSTPYVMKDIHLLHHRLKQIQSLLESIGRDLIASLNGNEAHTAYEYAISAYGDCTTYLKQISDKLKTELEEWVETETSKTESEVEVETAVQDLLEEVTTIDKLINHHEPLRDRIADWTREVYVYPTEETVEIQDDSGEDNALSESLSGLEDVEEI